MWKRKEKSGKIWYELLIDSNVLVLQGTKSFDPLKKMKGEPCELKQIHSSVIHKAASGVQLVGDGIFTDKKDLIIYVKTADCLPIILYHPAERILAILHSGWKGTLLRIVKKFFLRMKEKFSLEGSDWVAGFGPSIGMENYEVGVGIYNLFKIEKIPGVHIRNNRYFLDLEEANMNEMKKMGVRTFHTFPEETYSPEHFYSHRRGDTGRNITAGKII